MRESFVVRRRRRRAACAAAALAAALVTARAGNLGPLDVDLGGMSFRYGSYPVSGSAWQVGYKAAAAPLRRMRVLTGRTSDAGYGYVPLARRLVPPFRWQVTTGFPTAASSDGVGTGSFGAELLVSADSFDSYRISVTAPSGSDDLSVDAADLTQSQTGTGAVFAGAHAVDLAFDHDGTKLHLLTRAESADPLAPWTELAAVTPPADAAFFAVLSAYAIEKPAVIGFDGYGAVSSAPLPQGTPAGVQDLSDGFDAALRALHGCDGAAPDLDTVAADAGSAAAALKDARGALRGAARKKAGAAAAQAKSAAKLLARHQAVAQVVKRLQKCADAAADALRRVYRI